MSRRARSARRLASILTNASGVFVRVPYRQQRRGYTVEWTGGATAAEMYELAAKHADEVPELAVSDLAWLRTEPVPPAKR